MRRRRVLAWFGEALAAVDPRRRTSKLLRERQPATVIAIGKAAAAMTMGAADAWGTVSGVCVADAPAEVPPGVELLLGDHPVPGPASFEAGRRVLEVARESTRAVVLLSGGGSALCEHPLPGVPRDFLAQVTRHLLARGSSIGETNLVRSHLSAVKGGGLARAAGGELETLVLMDVGALGPEVVASGPTLGGSRDPERALEVMARYGIEVPRALQQAVLAAPDEPVGGPVEIVADGRSAAVALVDAVRRDGLDARLVDGWLEGPVSDAVDRLLAEPGIGVTATAGETTVDVRGEGHGGRNTHAALLVAARIAGEDAIFAALATDGVDGVSRAAGAIVDGETIARGGDPFEALDTFDSATYLKRSGDLVVTGRTGTNVADLWVLWRW